MSQIAGKNHPAVRNHIRKSRADKTFDWIIYTIAVLMTLLALYPMYFIVIASISDPNQVAQGNVLLWPKGLSLDGYKHLFSMGNLWTGYLNTASAKERYDKSRNDRRIDTGFRANARCDRKRYRQRERDYRNDDSCNNILNKLRARVVLHYRKKLRFELFHTYPHMPL